MRAQRNNQSLHALRFALGRLAWGYGRAEHRLRLPPKEAERNGDLIENRFTVASAEKSKSIARPPP